MNAVCALMTGEGKKSRGFNKHSGAKQKKEGTVDCRNYCS